MYPLAEGMFAPRNQWYIAAWSKEVTRAPMERWILNEPVAFYRTEAGEAVALAGRCPHRHFPLGRSTVAGDNIECGYHGIQFRPDGACALVPTQLSIPAACKVKSYPVAEKWQWIWIWPGDPAFADESLIPDHEAIGLTSDAYDQVGDIYFSVPGRYMLMHDNLFDLTHLNFLHRNSIAGGDLRGTEEIRNNGPDWISSDRNFRDVGCPVYFSPIFGYDGLVDRSVGMKLYMPCLHVGYDRFTRAMSTADKPGGMLGEIKVYHALTPATKHTAHYFFAMARNFARGDDAFGGAIMQKLLPTLEEDMFATKEIEQMLQNLEKMPGEVLLQADATCVRGRRLFEDLIRREMHPRADLGAA